MVISPDDVGKLPQIDVHLCVEVNKSYGIQDTHENTDDTNTIVQCFMLGQFSTYSTNMYPRD